MASLVEIRPLSKVMWRDAKQVLINDRLQTDGQTTTKHNVSDAHCLWRHKNMQITKANPEPQLGKHKQKTLTSA